MLVGLLSGIFVLIKGLGVTNLTDFVPWGLWITIDISAIALSAGAFSLCALVYLVGLDALRPLARTAAWIGLIGYTIAMTMLFLDIGRPDRFYYGFIFWNTHSVLWEVTMCVGLYFTVLILENSPVIADLPWLQKKFPRLANWLHKPHDYAPVLAVFGLGFSLLHQSSLGATYGVLIARPIWYRPGLAVLFIVSACAGGVALTVLASSLAGRFHQKLKINQKLLDRVAQVLGWVMLFYLYWRFWDYFAMTYTHQPGRTEGLSLITQGPLAFNFWFGEILLGAVIPIALLLRRSWRENNQYRDIALALIVAGVIAYRWDTNLSGQLLVQFPFDTPLQYTTYFPSLVEFGAALGAIALGLFIFTLGVKYLRVVDHSRKAML
jgi:Ni/Fe-hydrogenase subunit HybB-like protein